MIDHQYWAFVIVVDEVVDPFDQFYQYTSQQFVDDHHSNEYCLA
jgi:hypothetical protein